MGITVVASYGEAFYTCIAMFTVNTDLWTSHNIIADSHSLGLEWIPPGFLMSPYSFL